MAMPTIVDLRSVLIEGLLAEKQDMDQQVQVEHFALRYVPTVMSGDFVNIGLVMVAVDSKDFAEARFLKDWTPVLRLDPNADLDFLNAIAREISEKIRDREKRKHIVQQIKDSFSNNLQISEPQVSLADDPLAQFERLSTQYLSGADA